MDCSLLLGDDLSDGKASLLPVDHDLEALEVGEVGTLSSIIVQNVLMTRSMIDRVLCTHPCGDFAKRACIVHAVWSSTKG